ncbi:MAG: DNA-processing protein DprA [Candidatus Woesearchaeota archaeon]
MEDFSKGAQVLPEELMGPMNEIERKYSPEQIFLKGKKTLMEKYPRVSIIGTRKPSNMGKENTVKITRYLVKRDVVIVSGLALGVDSIAHRTTISEGGKTIAVIGTPLDTYYPRQNQELQDEIGENHLLLSQFPPNSPIQKHNFPMRNRTMALFSHATIIVEAGKTSGTQHQGWEALRLGRPLFIMENLVRDPSLKWPQKMIEYGAQPLKTANLDVLLECLPNPDPVNYNGSSV